MVTTAYIQSIFRRHRWSYQADEDGDIHTGFDGVPMIIFVRPNEVRVATIVYRTSGREQQSMRSRAHEVNLLLAAINDLVSDGYLEYDQQETVFFSTPVPMTGNEAGDEAMLVHGLQLTVLAFKGVGPAIYQIVTGQITVQQALNAIDRAVREQQRGRGAA